MNNWRFHEGMQSYTWTNKTVINGKSFERIYRFPKENRQTINEIIEGTSALLNIKAVFLWKYHNIDMSKKEFYEMSTLDAILWYMHLNEPDPLENIRKRTSSFQ